LALTLGRDHCNTIEKSTRTEAYKRTAGLGNKDNKLKNYNLVSVKIRIDFITADCNK